MVHDKKGTCRPMLYGTSDENIISLNRQWLNKQLLDATKRYDNVTIFFEHKVVSCTFESGEITFVHNGETKTDKVDLIIGNDGAFSIVRYQMMKHRTMRFDFQQKYIPHGYMQLDIRASVSGTDKKFAMEKNYIHAWPRGDALLLALPNNDMTFTAALFMDFELFKSKQRDTEIVEFFWENFPDARDLFEEEEVEKKLKEGELLPLISIKCYPYHFEDKAVIMGDAAHAMVPFYGQGMNCGFEDCQKLWELLKEPNSETADPSINLSDALKKYTTERHESAEVIVDLAMHNYDVLRSGVNSATYNIRRRLDRVLHRLFPKIWIPLYTTVSFTTMSYADCAANRAWQDKVLSRTCHVAVGLAVVAVLLPLSCYLHDWPWNWMTVIRVCPRSLLKVCPSSLLKGYTPT